MTQYFVKAHSFGDDVVLVHGLSVDGSGPVDTGLLDDCGHKIFRSPEPIGFVTEFKPRIRVKAVMK